MDALASGETYDFLTIFAQQDPLFGNLRVVFDDADDITMTHLVIKSEQQVRRAQVKEVQGM